MFGHGKKKNGGEDENLQSGAEWSLMPEEASRLEKEEKIRIAEEKKRQAEREAAIAKDPTLDENYVFDYGKFASNVSDGYLGAYAETVAAQEDEDDFIEPPKPLNNKGDNEDDAPAGSMPGATLSGGRDNASDHDSSVSADDIEKRLMEEQMQQMKAEMSQKMQQM
ncbi:MAG: hypothetical protein K6G62_05305, partial [Eubacterium sp.]|nr:hypothetical protein [Eubacterium sp.]